MFSKKVLFSKSNLAVMIAVVFLIVSISLNFSKVNAATSDDSPTFSRITEKEAEQIGINQWTQNFTDSAESELLSYSNELKLDYEKQHIMKAEKNGETAIFVYYPIIGGESQKDSQYIMVFDNNGKNLDNILMLGLKNKNGDIQSFAKSGGKEVLNAVIKSDGKVISGTSIHSNGEIQDLSKPTMQVFGFWSCLNDCLASQGVAAWAITALGIICAAGCAATAGLGCYVCLAGADIAAGSVVGYCWGQCK
ncbi:hypothetical protein [Paenibacillus sp. PSB04]|uniref:hypothetical protein n=1 Tax=Paenibacillus sp. PSB04 TaxID=2866810 RepID=UPI0021F13662|nr:hypothetical protein [Paenibacillus sp. PSB04]UYO06419.1 hypothetical protein K2F33_11330 [Paenibacillus sp. PSB04]